MYKRLLLKTLILFFFPSIVYASDIFLTLRNDKVNLRLGPSFDYPVKLFYKKKFLPVQIVKKSENFRKIKDHENNTGWIHVSQLSKKKAGIVVSDEIILYKKPTKYSKPLAVIRKGRLCKISKCKKNWCKITSQEFKGWIKKEALWGRI